MKLFFTKKKWSEYRESLTGPLGFVPTMGALHAGHLKLVHEARNNNDFVAVSIFVNPKQFNNTEDLINYPNTLEQDILVLSQAGVDAVFLPSSSEVYPENDTFITAVPGKSAEGLEGAFRPGHFEGVVNVVDRLFEWIHPHNAYFGQKDLQQCLVIQEFASEKHPNLKIVTVPTEREKNGLAMSSRNLRLSAEGRNRAAVIFEVISKMKDSTADYDWAIEYLKQYEIETEYLTNIEISLNTDTGLMTKAWVFAGYLEGIRLIDNVLYN